MTAPTHAQPPALYVGIQGCCTCLVAVHPGGRVTLQHAAECTEPSNALVALRLADTLASVLDRPVQVTHDAS